jgi:hypothetical protein
MGFLGEKGVDLGLAGQIVFYARRHVVVNIGRAIVARR